jgi:hypothetical protein
MGIFQSTSDYFFKPSLTMLFNGFIRPTFIFAQNMFQSLHDLLDPLLRIIGLFIDKIVFPFTDFVKNFRLIEVKNLQKKTLHPLKEDIELGLSTT